MVQASNVYNNVNRLAKFLKSHGLAGYDPYDALTNPFLTSVSRRSRLLARLGIQTLRLLPVNSRLILGIKPQLDAKALGLLGRAYYLAADSAYPGTHRGCASACLQLLESLQAHGFAGACWGHPFPYISSRSLLPADFPTVVSTVYAAQAFLDGYQHTRESHWLEIGRSACDFVLHDLSRIGAGERFCFSYYPGVDLPIHNASLLAAALLARVARLTGEDALLEPVHRALRYTLQDQQPDGSWPYDGPESPARANTFVDGFHTGFVLESLWDISRDAEIDIEEPITRGLAFYLDRLFEPTGRPRRFVTRPWPVDLRDCAQAMIVLSRLRHMDQRAEEMLCRVAEWTVENMQAPDGHFYYLRWMRWATPVPYIRFQAWMMVALTTYLGGMPSTV